MDSPFTRLPLYKGDSDNIVGVLHVKALLKAIRAHGGSAPHDLKIVEIANDHWFIPDTSPLLDKIQAFRERREQFAALADEYGSFMGVVILEDNLEESVGYILHQHDLPVPGDWNQGD